MNTYITLEEALSEPGAALVERDLRAEYEAGKLTLCQYLHLKQEQRLTEEWRSYKARAESKNPA